MELALCAVGPVDKANGNGEKSFAKNQRGNSDFSI